MSQEQASCSKQLNVGVPLTESYVKSRSSSVQTDEYKMEECGCDADDVEAEAKNIEEEIQATMSSYVNAVISSKMAQIEVLRKFMRSDIREKKSQPWCVECLAEAKFYERDNYYCFHCYYAMKERFGGNKEGNREESE